MTRCLFSNIRVRSYNSLLIVPQPRKICLIWSVICRNLNVFKDHCHYCEAPLLLNEKGSSEWSCECMCLCVCARVQIRWLIFNGNNISDFYVKNVERHTVYNTYQKFLSQNVCQRTVQKTLDINVISSGNERVCKVRSLNFKSFLSTFDSLLLRFETYCYHQCL